VRRWAAGLGIVMLRRAADAARERGASALRLDCVASNERLRAYYEAAGFLHCGDLPVAGPPGHRTDIPPTTLVSRYELPMVSRAANGPPARALTCRIGSTMSYQLAKPDGTL
jgi:hypothetical protein